VIDVIAFYDFFSKNQSPFLLFFCFSYSIFFSNDIQDEN
jgi:hypothetical protein